MTRRSSLEVSSFSLLRSSYIRIDTTKKKKKKKKSVRQKKKEAAAEPSKRIESLFLKGTQKDSSAASSSDVRISFGFYFYSN